MRRLSYFFLVLWLFISPSCSRFTTVTPPLVPTPLPSASLPPSPLPATPTQTLAPTSTLASTDVATPTDTPAPPTLTPTATPLPAAHYTITLDFSYDQKTAAVQMQIEYTNRSSEALPNLRLMIPPLAYPGAFTLKTIQWAGGQPLDAPAYTENGLELALPAALQPGQNAVLQIAYDLAIPSAASLESARPVPFGYSARQVNLVDWYPLVPPYVAGQGWLAHPNSYYGESLVYDLADFDVFLHLSDPRTDLVVAASTFGQLEGDRFHYRMPTSRSFAFSISPEYQVKKIVSGGVEISSYYFPAHPVAGEAAATITAESLALFGELFAPYPRQAIAVVEADFLDGMEYDGLFFVSRGMYNLYTGTPPEYFHALIVHEAAHQWWFALVGNDQAMEPWLDEALSTYSELLYYERYHPEAIAWWWDIRILYYRPSGWVNSSVYDHLGQPGNYDLYRNAVYFNGAVFLSELRKLVGEDAFFAFLKDYTQQYTGKVASGQDFFTLLASHTSADLQPLRHTFFK